MGIFICLEISHSVTSKEWEKVYLEALKLVECLPLAEKRSVEICGLRVECLVRTGERTVFSPEIEKGAGGGMPAEIMSRCMWRKVFSCLVSCPVGTRSPKRRMLYWAC